MAKNILVFSDGTGQAGGLRPDQRLSNVYKMFRASRVGPDSPINPAHQIAFYEMGLGTGELTGPGIWRAYKFVRELFGSAFGMGFMRSVADCYERILSVYEPGDRIYLFGFSRGAYIVRTVSGVMNLCGVPTKDEDGNPIPRSGRALRKIADEAVHDVYEHGAGHDRRAFEGEREEKARRFRVKYQTQDDEQKNERGDVVPYFIGVFDSVAALGVAGVKKAAIVSVATVSGVALEAAVAGLLQWLFGWDFWLTLLILFTAMGVVAVVYSTWLRTRSIVGFEQKTPSEQKAPSVKIGNRRYHLIGWQSKFYDRFLDPRVMYARHAQAIDETRASFPRVEWGRKVDEENPPHDAWLVQVWFAGNHSDIGGSYQENESRLSDIALKWMVDEATKIPNPLIIDYSKIQMFPDIKGVQHCEVMAGFELYPSWVPRSWRRSWHERARPDIQLSSCHPTVLERFQLPYVVKGGARQKYRPECLRSEPKLAEFYTNKVTNPVKVTTP